MLFNVESDKYVNVDIPHMPKWKIGKRNLKGTIIEII